MKRGQLLQIVEEAYERLSKFEFLTCRLQELVEKHVITFFKGMTFCTCFSNGFHMTFTMRGSRERSVNTVSRLSLDFTNASA